MLSNADYARIVANNLRRLMFERDVTQADVSAALGFSKQAVSAWCNGTRVPKMDKIDALCNFLNCSRGDIIEPHPRSLSAADFDGARAELIRIATSANINNVVLVLDLLKRLEGIK